MHICLIIEVKRSQERSSLFYFLIPGNLGVASQNTLYASQWEKITVRSIKNLFFPKWKILWIVRDLVWNKISKRTDELHGTVLLSFQAHF